MVIPFLYYGDVGLGLQVTEVVALIEKPALDVVPPETVGVVSLASIWFHDTLFSRFSIAASTQPAYSSG